MTLTGVIPWYFAGNGSKTEETAPIGEARVWWNVVSGRTHQLQTRPKLIGTTWADAGAPFVAGADAQHYADQAYDANAYFRVKVWVTE